MDSNKVVLGISGGIDSAAAAVILKEKGMDVHALYFDVKKEHDGDARKRVEQLCRNLNIEFIYEDLSALFEKIIIDPFCYSYTHGCTPMPCMVCNQYIKWKILKDTADRIDAKWIATGHYADIVEENGVFYVRKSKNSAKDQSYMLARLDQDILSRIVFPLNSFENKQDVKSFLKDREIDFPENLPESQDVCFIDTDYKDFLNRRGIHSKPGNFIDTEGKIIGRHNSFSDFTIGQGKGFGMGFNKKMYVKSIDPDTGNVTLCENKALFTDKIKISICSFAKYGEISYIPPEYENAAFDVKIRYAAVPSYAVLSSSSEEGIAELTFKETQRAPTPGQYAVFYKNDLLIGCGIIS